MTLGLYHKMQAPRRYHYLGLYDSYRSDPQGIFCYLDPKIGNHDRFVEIYHYLKDISPPVYYYDKESGYTIQKCIDGDYGMGYYDAMVAAMKR